MTTEDNKALVRRFYDEVWNGGDVAFAREVFAEDYVRHDLRPSEALPGGAGQEKIATDFRAAFPDLTMRVDLLVAEGDLVAARWTCRGTNTGAWGGQEPTGRSVEFCGVNIWRIQDGKVLEIWNHRDDLGLLLQVGKPIFAGATPEET